MNRQHISVADSFIYMCRIIHGSPRTEFLLLIPQFCFSPLGALFEELMGLEGFSTLLRLLGPSSDLRPYFGIIIVFMYWCRIIEDGARAKSNFSHIFSAFPSVNYSPKPFRPHSVLGPPPFLWGENEGGGPQDSVIKNKIRR